MAEKHCIDCSELVKKIDKNGNITGELICSAWGHFRACWQLVEQCSYFIDKSTISAKAQAYDRMKPIYEELVEALKEIVAEGTRSLLEVQQYKPVREIYNIDKVDRIARLVLAKVAQLEKEMGK